MTDDRPICGYCGEPMRDDCFRGYVEDGTGNDRKVNCPNAMASIARQVAMRRARDMAAIWPVPKRYASFTLTGDQFRSRPEYDQAREWLTHTESRIEPRGGSLIIAGGMGVGKTTLAAAVANTARERGLAVCFADEALLIDRLKATMDPRDPDDDGGDDYARDDLLEAARTCDLLVVDDVGKARATEWASELLWNVFNPRYNDLLPTVITTNAKADALAANAQWRGIIDRLQEDATSIIFRGSTSRRVGV